MFTTLQKSIEHLAKWDYTALHLFFCFLARSTSVTIMTTNAAAPTTVPAIIPGRLPGKQGRRLTQSLVKNVYDHYST